jgi:hypothetical protein
MADNSLIMYHVNDENKKIQIEVLCLGLSIPTKELKPTDLNEQVGKLAGIKGTLPQPTSTDKIPVIFSMPELILFSGVSSVKLDEFLQSYKSVGLTPTKLKAVITPNNVRWTLYQLINELSQEALRMDKVMKDKKKDA